MNIVCDICLRVCTYIPLQLLWYTYYSVGSPAVALLKGQLSHCCSCGGLWHIFISARALTGDNLEQTCTKVMHCYRHSAPLYINPFPMWIVGRGLWVCLLIGHAGPLLEGPLLRSLFFGGILGWKVEGSSLRNLGYADPYIRDSEQIKLGWSGVVA